LQDQKIKCENGNKEMFANLDYIKEQAHISRNALEKGDLNEFAKIMNDHWIRKRSRSKFISNSKIDALYSLGLKSGALGGKVVGAGGGGFLMFYAEDKKKLRFEMQRNGLQEVIFGFDFQGTKLIYG
jgi:D-glycero-alpha-D-manno-heptose-7-phosphate kinase